MVALKTFNNLSRERKEEIIWVSMMEFALNDYQTASLSSIIKKLGLAKGSFYRYFENKHSLYYYLLEYCVQKRLENDKQAIQEVPEDFFELILLHFKAKLQFNKNYPLASAFLDNVLQEKNNKELGNIQHRSKQAALQILEDILDGFLKKGQIRTDLDKKLIAWHVLETQISIFSYIEHHFQIDGKENIIMHNQLYDLPEDQLIQIAQQFIQIQKNGLSL